MTLNQKLRTLQFVNLCISIIGLCYYDLSYFLLSYLIFILLCPIGVSAGLHRYFTHKSFKTSKFWERTMLLLSVYATVGSSIAWVGVHRAHHTFTDKLYDPHSPYDGIFKAWTGVGRTETKIPVSFVKDLLRDPAHRFIHDHYFKILLIPVVALFIINPTLGVFLYALPATLTLQTTSFVNVLGHLHGYRSYNHHNKPNNYSLKEQSNEWDLIGYFIRLIKL